MEFSVSKKKPWQDWAALIDANVKPKLSPGSYDYIERIFKKAIEHERSQWQEAVIWMSGSHDFGVSGKARAGFLKLVKPLLDSIPEPPEETP